MIPAEAVEAAAASWLYDWETTTDGVRMVVRERMKEALEAAASYIRAAALLDAADNVAIRGDIISKDNGGLDAWDYLRARAEAERPAL